MTEATANMAINGSISAKAARGFLRMIGTCIPPERKVEEQQSLLGLSNCFLCFCLLKIDRFPHGLFPFTSGADWRGFSGQITQILYRIGFVFPKAIGALKGSLDDSWPDDNDEVRTVLVFLAPTKQVADNRNPVQPGNPIG